LEGETVMRLPNHAPYFTACENMAPLGKFHWVLHEAVGHEYHIETGFNSMAECLADMADKGAAILDRYNKERQSFMEKQ
jgi:hypothetical protein